MIQWACCCGTKTPIKEVNSSPLRSISGLIPQLGLRLIRTRHGNGCCRQYPIGEADVPAGDAVCHVQEEAGDSVIAYNRNRQ